MMTNTNFVGSDSANLTVIPVTHSESYTVIQALERDSSEHHPIQTHVAQVVVNPTDLFNLITALTMRYNDIPERYRDEKIELKRVIQEKPVSPDNQELPY